MHLTLRAIFTIRQIAFPLFIGLFVSMILHPTHAIAGYPLITDDTGTQGAGKTQLEFDGQYEHEHQNGTKENNIQVNPMLSYGLAETVDVIISNPYQYNRTQESGTTTRERGFTDTSVEVKWRFYEKDGLSFAVKPGVTVPTGNDHKDLGTGKATYTFYFIATKELKPWMFHLNLGYIRNENTQGARKDIWDASLASECLLTKDLRVVGNIGVERSDDPVSGSNPAFLLGGLVYSLSDTIDVDAGYKYGLTRSEPDQAILAGLTFRF